MGHRDNNNPRNSNPRINWERAKRLYRAGLLSNYEIARECKTTEANIRYRAKKEGWKKDLTDEVRQTARTKMIENLASVQDAGNIIDGINQVEDSNIIEQAARTQVEVVRQHQKTLGNGHSLTMRMLNELDVTTTHRGELEDMIKSTIAPRRQGAALAAISLPQRATVMRDLATAARLWVTLERQAFSIADDREKDNKDRQKLDEMTAEQLRAEIKEDAKKIGLDLTELGGVANKATNGSGKVH
jgi:hypothetical protein